jgi:hypothetical protein
LRLNKQIKQLFYILGGVLLIAGLVILTGQLDAFLTQFFEDTISRRASSNWPGYFRIMGSLIFIAGLLILAQKVVLAGLQTSAGWIRRTIIASDHWIELNFSRQVDIASTRLMQWPLTFNYIDWLFILFFLFLALVFQLEMSSRGFPTVILGGDAANIASFAAGRAYPELFNSDAILGNLNNIGLYTTIHLPITIWLEKLVGNFGLAYSLLLFPHVFLQYFAYYLLGRVVFNQRYWAFLFTLATSAPLALAGGELWGVVGDGMPRFTYQVIIPFILILMLTQWRNRPERWPWLMVIAGLLAFIHPVSTPTWAFALWLGLWPCMPSNDNWKKKLITMIKMGIILTIALLPYVSIYLFYKKGGSANSNYDLVYYILTNYFPYDLMDIPAAVKVLFRATSEFGLLWYGVAGLLITALAFKTERSRLKQMLFWIAGISIVTILIPFVEQTIERTLRIIPLQTELMRGMRYLVPFLFIFWFYPLAEFTRRAKKANITRLILIIGTITTAAWMIMNTPYPITSIQKSINCWSQGQFICPTQDDYADALQHIQTKTPEKAKFVVFLTNRWSGIEVRYLGLRPMVYAYKDRGQLTFTNLDALNNWFYYLQRENGIYSRHISPTLDLQQQRMIDFARDAQANYMLTDFPFPKSVRRALGVTLTYQNDTYTIIKIYNMK